MSEATCGSLRGEEDPGYRFAHPGYDDRIGPAPIYCDAMVRYRRHAVHGGSYFFTVALWDRRSMALISQIGMLRAAFRATRRERPFTIDAAVVLPDHLHAIMTLPPGDADFAGRWRRIKGYFSTRLLVAGIAIGRHANGELALWQRRYWEHTIRDEDDFGRHVDYIHYNPVKHRLVTRVRDWPYSSFHLYVRQGCCRKTGQAMSTKALQVTANGGNENRMW